MHGAAGAGRGRQGPVAAGQLGERGGAHVLGAAGGEVADQHGEEEGERHQPDVGALQERLAAYSLAGVGQRGMGSGQGQFAVPVASSLLRFSGAPWAVAARQALRTPPTPRPPGEETPSGLKWEAMAEDLRDFPDQALVSALRFGCDILYTGALFSSNHPNHASAAEVEEELAEQIERELKADIIGGGTTTVQGLGFPHVRVSPLGATSKRNSTEMRRFDDCTFGGGVNTGIPDLPPSRMATVDLIAIQLAKLKEVYSVVQCCKVDLRHAFRQVPVRKADYWLLAFAFQGKYYHHKRLPFGCRSSPLWFERLAVAVCWAMAPHLPHGVVLFAMLDDYILLGPPRQIRVARAKLLQLFARWGLTVNEKKLLEEGTPRTVQTVFGVVMDSELMQLRLDESRLADIHQELAMWEGRTHCTRRQLQSVIGVLSFASKVIRPGRLFLSRMLDVLRASKGNPRSFRLSEGFKLDLEWWQENMRGWNGISCFPAAHPSNSVDLEFATDASSEIGYGGTLGNCYFHGLWEAFEKRGGHKVIGLLELVCVYFACETFAEQLRGKRIKVHCDNEGDVHILTGNSSKKPAYNAVLRALHTCMVQYDFTLVAVHKKGSLNVCPDALSRNDLPKFKAVTPYPSSRLRVLQVPEHARHILKRVLLSN